MLTIIRLSQQAGESLTMDERLLTKQFDAGSRVWVKMWDGWPRKPAEVVEVIDFTDKGGILRERRVVLLDEPLEGERRWNLELASLADSATNGPERNG